MAGHDSSPRSAGIAVVYVGIAGNMFIALSPIFWGGFSQFLHLPDSRIGEIMSAEFLGATVSTVAGIFYMYRPAVNLRQVAFASLAIYVIGNALTPLTFAHPGWLRAVRLICGLSTGTSYLAAATAITSLGSPSRLVAIFYGTPYAAGALLQPLMRPVFERWGFSAGFELMAVAAAASLAVYPFFPRQGSNDVDTGASTAGTTSSLRLLLILSGALLVQYIANSGIWLFFDRIGTMSGHSDQTVANVVGMGTGVALVGAVLATLLAEKITPLWGIVTGTALLVISSMALHLASNLAIYAGSVAVFNAMITFVTPFYFIVLVAIFAPAKAVIVGNICMMLGFALGPLLIGYTVHDDGFARSINATVGLFLLSTAMLWAFAILRRPPMSKE